MVRRWLLRGSPELIVTCPLCRAVQTAIIAFFDYLPQNIDYDNRKGNSKKKNGGLAAGLGFGRIVRVVVAADAAARALAAAKVIWI